MAHPHFLLLAFPAQGHINPALQFAKRVLATGARVTLTTCVSAERRMGNVVFPDGLSFTTFSDGYDDGLKPDDDRRLYISELRRRSTQTLHDLIINSENESTPFTYLIYNFILPWAAEVAREHNLPCSLLWIQPATVFDVYFYYFNGYKDELDACNDKSHVVELPGLPRLAKSDLPSFIARPGKDNFILEIFQELIEGISNEANPKVLVNTFDALEANALNALDKVDLIGIGPLIPSAFLDRKDVSDKSFGCDLFQNSKDEDDYTQWLKTKPKCSVVYVSFGSISVLSKRQMQEIARGLISSQFSFLWVIRDDQKNKESDVLDGYREELEQRGKIVAWCSQLEVLSDPSVGCFVTHCGWNSTVESLVCGVPVVAFPQWTDQGTNAKLIADEWRAGVRVQVAEDGEGGVLVEGEEIKRCLDLVMGGAGIEMRENAKKCKDLARDAVVDGGSSDKNLKNFVHEVVRSLKLVNSRFSDPDRSIDPIGVEG